MKNIAAYARLVKIISYLLMPIVVISFFYKWLSPEIALCNPNLLYLSFFYHPDSYIYDVPLSEIPLIHRFLGMAIDSISFSLFLVILLLVGALMSRFQNNEAFSSKTVALFTTISKLSFYIALYIPFSRALLTIVTTLHKHPHTLGISFEANDLFAIFVYGFLMVMTLSMQQAAELKKEQSLTI